MKWPLWSFRHTHGQINLQYTLEFQLSGSALLRIRSTMSLESLQLRLSALQESTAQLRKLIDQLDDINKLGSPADTHFVDVSDAETSSEEISADIKKLLRDGEDNTEALAGELEFYQPEGPHKDELQEATDAVGKDLRK